MKEFLTMKGKNDIIWKGVKRIWSQEKTKKTSELDKEDDWSSSGKAELLGTNCTSIFFNTLNYWDARQRGNITITGRRISLGEAWDDLSKLFCTVIFNKHLLFPENKHSQDIWTVKLRTQSFSKKGFKNWWQLFYLAWILSIYKEQKVHVYRPATLNRLSYDIRISRRRLKILGRFYSAHILTCFLTAASSATRGLAIRSFLTTINC